MVIPVKLNKKGGIAPVSIPARLLKIIVNVIDVNKGWIKYHNGPKTVCLWAVITSLFTKSNNKSRYCQTSLKFIEKNWFFGDIV